MAGNAGGIRAGKAFVEVSADDSKLKQAFAAMEKSFKSVGSSVTSIGLKMSAVGAAINAPFLAAAKIFADTGSELNDMSTRTGMSVEALSQLGHAAGMTGSDMATVEIGARKLQKNLSAAAGGSDSAAESFAKLGLDFRKLIGLSPDEQFQAVARAIGKVQNPALKAGAAMEIFGKSGTSLIPLIDDFDALTGEAKKFGLTWTGDEAKNADALGDALDLVVSVGKRVFEVIGGAIAPSLTEMSATIASVGKQVIDWVKNNQSLIVTVFKVASGIAVAGAGITALGLAISGIGSVLGVIAAGFAGLGTALAVITSTVGLVTVGLVAGAYAFVTYSDMGSQALSWLGDQFSGLQETATTAFKGISDALASGDIALAGQILWAALNVEWLKGVAMLKSVWADFGAATVDVFSGVSFAISGIFIDLQTGIESIWADMVAGLTGTWGDLVKTLLTTLNPLTQALKLIGIDLTNVIDQGIKAAGLTLSDPAALQQKQAAIGQSNIDQHSALATQQQVESDARRAAAQQGVSGAVADVQKAKDELAALTATAGENAMTGAAVVPKKNGGPAFDPAAIDKGLEKVQKTVDVKGSFSGAALRGLGAGDSVADAVKDGVKEAKKTNDKLDKLNRTIESAKGLD